MIPNHFKNLRKIALHLSARWPECESSRGYLLILRDMRLHNFSNARSLLKTSIPATSQAMTGQPYGHVRN